MIGRTVPNTIADRKLGPFNMMITMTTLITVLILGLFLSGTSSGAIIAFAALFGFASGGGVGLAPVLCASISPIQDIGVRTGTVFSIAAFAALSGSPIGGQILTISHGVFRNTIIFGGVSSAVATALFVCARFTLAGFRVTKV